MPLPEDDSGQGLSARTRMPVGFAARDGDIPTPFAPLLRRLIDIGGLGGVQEADDADSDSAASTEQLRRLHTKIDLLLWMGAELVAIHRPLPASRALRLYPKEVVVEMDGVPQGGERQWLLLYCLDGLPMPLPLPVRVAARAGEDGEGALLHCAIDAPDAQTAELYHQLLFKQHRREVAARRGG